MNLIFATNARFTQTKNGNVYGIHTSISRSTFDHYLEVFSEISIIARIELSNEHELDERLRINDDKVQILDVPYYIGPIQYVWNYLRIRKRIRHYLETQQGAIICRIPGVVGRLTAEVALSLNKPYAAEVAADPYDVFAPGSFNHPLRAFLRTYTASHLRKNMRRAAAGLYVTSSKLQKRYPVNKGVYQTYASNVILKLNSFSHHPKCWSRKEVYQIVSMGTLDQLYKSPDILLKAIALVNSGLTKYKVTLKWLGDGKYRVPMEELSKYLGIGDYVKFAGTIKSSDKVRKALDQSDIFILPSRTEGLPRAMVEAMARALPSIGTDVGGIPELLDPQVLVDINSVDQLAGKIKEILESEEMYNTQSELNLSKSKDYELSILNERRFEFYRHLEHKTKDSVER